MNTFALQFFAEQAARAFLGWLRDVPALLAALFTAWQLWPDPVPAPLFFGEFPAGAADRTVVNGLPPIVRRYVAEMPQGTATR